MVDKLEVGLNQEWSVPSDSYVVDYFEAQTNWLRVGPPVYFVVRDGYDYADRQKSICISAGCDSNSLGVLLNDASKHSNESYIASAVANNWVDDFIGWSSLHDACCHINSSSGDFCPRNLSESHTHS